MHRPLILVLAADARCSVGCAVTLRSVLSRLQPDLRAQVFVILHGVPSAHRKAIRETVSMCGQGHSLDFVSFSPSDVARLSRSRLITHTAYATCLLDELLPKSVERCLYMDCDIVATRDMGELWDHDLAGTTVGAVEDGHHAVLQQHQARLGLSEARYFNSGVLLVDMRLWRDRQVGRRAMDAASRIGPHLILHDQDALNVALEGDWVSLPPSWNTWTILPGLSSDDPINFHYMGAPKPWHADYDRPFADLFFRELDETAFAGWRPWNPLGLGVRLARIRRRLPWIPGVLRVLRAQIQRMAMGSGRPRSEGV